MLNEDTERGGVMINTWHLPQEADTLVSNLTLYRAGPRDKVGLRYCQAQVQSQIQVPNPGPKSRSQIQVPNPSSKSKFQIQSPEERN